MLLRQYIKFNWLFREVEDTKIFKVSRDIKKNNLWVSYCLFSRTGTDFWYPIKRFCLVTLMLYRIRDYSYPLSSLPQIHAETKHQTSTKTSNHTWGWISLITKHRAADIENWSIFLFFSSTNSHSTYIWNVIAF